MRTVAWVLCGVCMLLMGGCGLKGSDSKSAGRVPDFRIAEIQNTSTAKHRRFLVKVSLPSHYSESAVRSTLVTLSNTLNEPESEITMLFYSPNTNLRNSYDVARVVWKNNSPDEFEYKPQDKSATNSSNNAVN